MKRFTFRSAFFNPRVLIALLLWAGAGLTSSGTLVALSRHEAPGRAQRTLTFEERVSYQRAIEDVYWRHRIWPKENLSSKPSLDAVISQSQLEKKVTDYLLKSQALEDYWQRPITAEQLQAEMDRMARGTKQPEVLREVFEALGKDPFVVAECLARPALADRLVTSWYAYDEKIHGQLKQRAETELHAHPAIDQMKQLSGKYSEVELVKSDSTQGEDKRSVGSVKLNSREWDETVQKLTAMLGDAKNNTNHTNILSHGARLAGDKAVFGTMTEIKVGVLSSLQEDEGHFYTTAVTGKTDDRVKLATVSWLKEPRESWLARGEEKARDAVAVTRRDYTLPKITEGAGCINDTWTVTSGPPDARASHTSVWTGSEIIVWGGAGFGTYFSTGAKYDPSTDTWTATSTTNAPTARAYHTSVWTGSEMIVWGGYSSNGTSHYFSTGRRYNPATDSWTATSTTSVPAARELHTAVWTGSEMIVWGGYFYDGAEHWLNTGGRYDPGTNSWTATSINNAPSARQNHTAVWTGNEMIVWGGYDGSNYLNTGGRYNPSADSWTATSTTNVPTGRWYHTAVWTGSEMIVWGGQNYPTFLSTGGRYTPGTDNWVPISTTNAPSPRVAPAVWTGNEMIVWGGYDGNWLDTGGRYNPSTDNWAATNFINAPSPRNAHTAVWTGNEMIVWGGGTGRRVNTGGRYSPSMDSWTATGSNNAPSPRAIHTAIWTGSEMIVWGGYYYPPGDAWNTGGRYNLTTDSWTATSTTNAPAARYYHTAVWTGSEMIIWGGTDQTNYLSAGGRYNPGADSWTATSTTNAPIARWLHTAVWSGSEMIVWGGDDENFNQLNTGGRYNPITDSWVATSTTNAPTARASHRAVWTGSEIIVWGGWNGPNALNSGGRYDPGMDSWIATTTTNAPSARYYHTAVWTGSEMIVWGGYHEFNELNTGGRYNPSMDSWIATTTINAPSARFNHTAVWIGSEMIVWGGSTFVGDGFDTGERYNPGTHSWTAASTNPPARSTHTAVWTGSEMIVWGGYDGAEYLNTGGRYCAQSASPTPTPTATASATATSTPTATVTATATATATATVTATATATATATFTPTPRVAPTARVRPTPPPRP